MPNVEVTGATWLYRAASVLAAGLGVTGRSDNGVLLPMRPVARTPPVMCDGKNSQLLCGDLIDDAVGKPTEDISSAGATKYSTEQRIGQNEIGCSFKLSHKYETKPDIRFQRIECGRVVQFGER